MGPTNINSLTNSTESAFQYWDYAYKNQAVLQFFNRVDHKAEHTPPRTYNFPVELRTVQPTNWFLVVLFISAEASEKIFFSLFLSNKILTSNSALLSNKLWLSYSFIGAEYILEFNSCKVFFL